MSIRIVREQLEKTRSELKASQKAEEVLRAELHHQRRLTKQIIEALLETGISGAKLTEIFARSYTEES